MNIRYYARESSLMMSLTSNWHSILSQNDGAMSCDELNEFDYSKYSSAYTNMHRALDKNYSHLVSKDQLSGMKQSEFEQVGYTYGSIAQKQEMVDKWDKLISENVSIRNLQEKIINDNILLDQFCADWVGLVNSDEFVEKNGFKLLIYNGFTDVLIPDQDRLSISGKWHYDNYTPGSFVRYMFFLNDFEEHGGGIDIFDRNWSSHFSDSTGYVGLPLDKRLTDIAKLCELTGNEYHPHEVRPSSSDYLCFSSSRCIHRGINPTKGPRRSVFLCGVPCSPSVPTEAILNYSRSLLASQQPGSDLIPVFRVDDKEANSPPSTTLPICLDDPSQVHNYVSKHICHQLGLASESSESRLIRLLCDRVTKSSSQSELMSFVKADLHLLSHSLAGLVPLREKFNGYLDDVNRELFRYQPDSTKLRSHIYWPNPTHPKYGRTLSDEKPYTSSIPLIDKSTPLATAGSCFAYEIARVFQERGYNYVVTEKPEPSQGIYASDYEPGDKFVPFSANFGILFNTPSLLQLAQRAFGEFTFQRLLMKRGGAFHDPYRETVFFASPEAYAWDYDRHTSALQQMLMTTRVFIFTLGLNECWRLRGDGTALSRNPDSDMMPYAYHQRLTVAENVESIARFYELVRRYNPDFKLILSLSPIPFLATGLADKEHVIAANCHSKATLRVAAQELADKYSDVYYFPSYELIHYCESNPWEDDLRHVRRETVKRVISLFEEMFVA